MAIPVSPTFSAALARIPAHEAATAVASSQGAVRIYNGFSAVWQRLKTGLEEARSIAPGLALEGLRQTAAFTLRQAGLDERRVADLSGRETPSMAQQYSRSASLADKNREMMAFVETENARRETTVKPSAEKHQTRSKWGPDMTT